MDKEKIIEALNNDRADELGAIMQYMGHHYMAKGMESAAIKEIFKDLAMDEMRHAQMLAERIVYLGGELTIRPSEIKRGGDIKKMLQDDLDAENMAIPQYKEDIRLCIEMDDPTTRRMLESILEDEEGHADRLETTLG